MTQELVQCPRCGLYSRSPDDHILEPSEYDPRKMWFCTPKGPDLRKRPIPLPPQSGWHRDTAGELAWRPHPAKQGGGE
jgi:hypothetical protein